MLTLEGVDRETTYRIAATGSSRELTDRRLYELIGPVFKAVTEISGDSGEGPTAGFCEIECKSGLTAEECWQGLILGFSTGCITVYRLTDAGWDRVNYEDAFELGLKWAKDALSTPGGGDLFRPPDWLRLWLTRQGLTRPITPEDLCRANPEYRADIFLQLPTSDIRQ
jgi:hypothetical protein